MMTPILIRNSLKLTLFSSLRGNAHTTRTKRLRNDSSLRRNASLVRGNAYTVRESSSHSENSWSEWVSPYLRRTVVCLKIEKFLAFNNILLRMKNVLKLRWKKKPSHLRKQLILNVKENQKFTHGSKIEVWSSDIQNSSLLSRNNRYFKVTGNAKLEIKEKFVLMFVTTMWANKQ